MKTCYPLQKIDLHFQIDHSTPKKVRFFEEYDDTPTDTNFCFVLLKHRKLRSWI